MLVHDCPLWRLLATAQRRPSWLENLVEGLVLHANPARRCSFSYSTFSRLERCDKQSGGHPGVRRGTCISACNCEPLITARFLHLSPNSCILRRYKQIDILQR